MQGDSTMKANANCQPRRKNWGAPDPEELAARSASQAINKKSSFRPYHAIRVPKSTSLANVFHKACADDQATAVTTVMLRHIPNKYTQANLLDEVNQAGFAGRYDFFYLPMDVHNRTNVGYAFINFLTPQDAQIFKARMTDYKFQKYSSQKIAKVAPAHIQGLIRNLYHFANRAVAQSQDVTYRPIIMCNGLARDCLEVLEDHRRAKIGRLRSQGQAAAPMEAAPQGLMPPPNSTGVARSQGVRLQASGLPIPSTDEVPVTSLSVPGELDSFGDGCDSFAQGTAKDLQNCELAQDVFRCFQEPQHSNEMREDFALAIFHLKQASSVLVGLGLHGMLHQPNYEVVHELTHAINSVAARVKDVGVSVTGMPLQDIANQEFVCDMLRSDDLSLSSSGTTTPPPLSYQSGQTGMKYIESFPQCDTHELTPRRSQMLLGSDLWNASASMTS
mmetsp:Transcript_147055/g.273864  ORF Transcript_147055/g.273864 Transcript_147055/m.273864 type:complete len:446 (-) Transcript_147055:380-1717(-)